MGQDQPTPSCHLLAGDRGQDGLAMSHHDGDTGDNLGREAFCTPPYYKYLYFLILSSVYIQRGAGGAGLYQPQY